MKQNVGISIKVNKVKPKGVDLREYAKEYNRKQAELRNKLSNERL